MTKTELSSTSISVKGDRQYVLRLKALAALQNISLAELTRRALDAAYGEVLQAQAVFFDTSSVAQKLQSFDSGNGPLSQEANAD